MPPRPSRLPAPGSPRLAHDLALLVEMARGQALPIARMLSVMDERGYPLALVLLAFPFVLPVPSLGMAGPMGLFLAVAGLGLVRHPNPSLPRFLERRSVAFAVLRALSGAVEAVRAAQGRVVRPRMAFLTSGPLRALVGLSLTCAALIMALPIPVPLSNFFPAVAILILAVGLLEGDGLLVLVGHVATVGLCVGVYFLWSAVCLGLHRVLALVS